MSYTPHKYIKKAINTKLTAIGYAKQNAFPRVEVHSFDTTPAGAKEDLEYEVTFIIEVIDENTSPSRSLDLIEDIRTKIDADLIIQGWKLVILNYELLTEIEEITDTDSNIFRQIQRVRTYIKKQ